MSGVVVAMLLLACGLISFQLARIDWATGRLPNRLMTALLVVAMLLVGVELVLESNAQCRLVDVGGGCSLLSSLSLWISIGLVGVGLALPLLVLNIVSPSSIGFGDVKLAAVMSVLLGIRWWTVLPSPLFVGVGTLLLGMCCGLVSLVMFRRGDKTIPLGPGLIFGGWLMFGVLAIAGGG